MVSSVFVNNCFNHHYLYKLYITSIHTYIYCHVHKYLLKANIDLFILMICCQKQESVFNWRNPNFQLKFLIHLFLELRLPNVFCTHTVVCVRILPSFCDLKTIFLVKSYGIFIVCLHMQVNLTNILLAA